MPVTSTSVFREIWDCLDWNKTNAKDAKAIARELGIERGRTEEKTRDIIREMVLCGYPVASCGEGYFKTLSEEELREYHQSLKSRISGIEKRIAAIDKMLELVAAGENEAPFWSGSC